ncbi:dipeptidase [Biformimicrobium ophioploci]|uniref:Dipeptidase n=2 Tax=Biformimicrobium ophioploci TaxID=3036711 RepID=A0ABQ6M2T8_9GAMM|nr:dipeptidase [Microbulbifer sp. NKW57]
MKFIQRMDRQITLYQDSLSKITSKQDVDNSLRNNTTGIIYGFQDTEQLEGNIENIDPFYTAGVRCMQLTYNTENRVGSGCIVKEDKGLKPFGEELVSALNRKNILIDLSHCSIKTTEAALRLSTKPAAITHSGCSALQPHPRNKSDHQLKAMADKGGVVGIYFMPFLRSSGMAQSADVIAHIEHAINVCGEDHVGIGTDNQVTPTTITDEYRKKFNANVRERREKGIGAPNEQEDVFLFIEDLNTTSRFIDLAALLKKRGHSERRVEKIMGGNFRRLFGGVL